jgi:hypothetical protein
MRCCFSPSSASNFEYIVRSPALFESIIAPLTTVVNMGGEKSRGFVIALAKAYVSLKF